MERYECHGHMMMDGADYTEARKRYENGVDEAAVRAAFAALAKEGVTYFRDGGDRFGVSAFAREIAPEYGIEYRTPVFAIHKNGHYGSIVGRGFSDLAQYRERVREAASEGADFIKIMTAGIITFREYGRLSCPSLEEREIREMVHIAHEEGFAVMMHVNGPEAVRAAVWAGTDSIEHGAFPEEETIGLLAGSETIWVPTIAAIAAFDGRAGFDPAVTRRTLTAHLEAVGRAARMGALLAAGSDSGAVGVPHGAGTLAEYALLAKAGVSPEQLREGSEAVRRRFRRL